MNIEQQVCSLEQAKRLKELGVKQDSYLCFSHPKESYIKDWQAEGYKVKLIKGELYGFWTGYENYSAFTVAELGVMLPNESGVRALTSYYNDHIGSWYCESRIFDEENDNALPDLEYEVEEETEAQARAAMLIYLLENNIVTADEVNK